MEKWIAYPDCTVCRGKGWHIGGDEEQQCPTCRLRKRRAHEIEISRLIPNEYGMTWEDVIEHIRSGCCEGFAEINERIELDLRAGKEIVEPIEVMTWDDVYIVLDGHHRTALSLAYGRTHVPFYTWRRNIDKPLG